MGFQIEVCFRVVGEQLTNFLFAGSYPFFSGQPLDGLDAVAFVVTFESFLEARVVADHRVLVELEGNQPQAASGAESVNEFFHDVLIKRLSVRALVPKNQVGRTDSGRPSNPCGVLQYEPTADFPATSLARLRG